MPDAIFPLVLSADVTAAMGNLSKDEPPDLYAEISVSGSDFLQRTRVASQSKRPSWNEELPMLYVPNHILLKS